MKFITIIICLITFSAAAYSQDMSNLNVGSYPFHYVGAAASTLSAPGISYKTYINPRIGFKVTGFIYSMDEDYDYTSSNYMNFNNDEELFYMVGGEFHYVIVNTAQSRFYGLAGLGYFYNSDKNNNSDYNYGYNNESLDTRFTTGAGFGFEISLWEHIVFDIQACLQYVADENKNYSNGQLISSKPAKGTNIGGGIGIYFKF